MLGGRRGIHFSKSETKNLGNPFRFQSGSGRGNKGKHTLAIPGLILAILGSMTLLYWLFFTPAFAITSIQVQSGIALPADTISQIVQAQLNSTRLHIFPQSNLFAFDADTLGKQLQERFALEHVTVSRNRPHTLMVTVSEKPREAIWSAQGKFYALDISGVVQGEIAAPQNTTIPVIYDQSGGDIAEHAQIIDPIMLQFIARLLHDPTIEPMQPQFVLMTNPKSSELMIKVKEGWKLHLTKDASLESQLANLNLTLSHSVTPEKRSKLEYIDVRFGEKIYVKYR